MGKGLFPQLRDRRHRGVVGAPGAGAVEAMVDSGAAGLPVRLYTKPPAAVDWSFPIHLRLLSKKRAPSPPCLRPHPPSTENWLTYSVLMLNPARCPHSAASLPPAADVRDPQGYEAWCVALSSGDQDGVQRGAPDLA